MSKFFKDRTGKRYGKLVAIRVVGKNRHNGVLRWLCECDCGNTRICSGSDLTSGHILSCGCLNKLPGKPPEDITGRKYGRLIVLNKQENNNNYNKGKWLCRCACGNELFVHGSSLRSGNTRSCGCLKHELCIENMTGDKNPMKRPEIAIKLSGENSPAKRIEVREKHTGKNNHFYGKHHAEETKKKISTANKGLLLGNKNPRYGIRLSNEAKLHQSIMMKGRFTGKNAPNWQGGISFGKYCPKFDKNLKERVRSFFNHECVLCGKSREDNGQNLSVHHVNYDKMLCCNDNIIQFVALCINCHTKTNHNRNYWEKVLTIIIHEIYNGKSYYTKEEYKKLKNN